MTQKKILALDACVLINLLATEMFDEIASAAAFRFVVVDRAAGEVGHLRVEVDGELEVLEVDLGPHAVTGTIDIVGLADAELEAFVELSLELGDGEAATIAVASSRGWLTGTDDVKARRLSMSRGLAEPIRTSDIIRAHCERTISKRKEVLRMLTRVRDRASFVPARSDPNRKWWLDGLAA